MHAKVRPGAALCSRDVYYPGIGGVGVFDVSALSAEQGRGEADATRSARLVAPHVSQGHYSLLRYGVRFFLQFGSGNAYLERVFGDAERLTCDKRRNRLDLTRHILLRENGSLVGLEGYVSPVHDEPDSIEDLDA